MELQNNIVRAYIQFSLHYAQRLPVCHDYLRHGRGFWRDGWWQLNCELRLANPPAITIEELVEFCDGKIARYKHPRSLFTLDALPRNSMGKVLRRELREQFWKA